MKRCWSERVASDEAVFRVYTWAEPTLSFGRNQTARGTYDPERARERGVTVVRRLTGGRALLHHREVTYSVTAPLALGRLAPRIVRAHQSSTRRRIAASWRRGGGRGRRASVDRRHRPRHRASSGRRLVSSWSTDASSWAARSGATREPCCSTDRFWSRTINHWCLHRSETTYPSPPPAATLTAALGRTPAVERGGRRFVRRGSRRSSVQTPRRCELDSSRRVTPRTRARPLSR